MLSEIVQFFPILSIAIYMTNLCLKRHKMYLVKWPIVLQIALHWWSPFSWWRWSHDQIYLEWIPTISYYFQVEVNKWPNISRIGPIKCQPIPGRGSHITNNTYESPKMANWVHVEALIRSIVIWIVLWNFTNSRNKWSHDQLYLDWIQINC